MPHAMEHRHQPWWKRPLVWLIAVAVLATVVFVVVEESSRPGRTAYGTFLDQLEAGNVASVTFQGTEINGRFKRPLRGEQRDALRSRVPDFGDPALIVELRMQHVAIDVKSPSPWTSMLSRVPWPLLLSSPWRSSRASPGWRAAESQNSDRRGLRCRCME